MKKQPYNSEFSLSHKQKFDSEIDESKRELFKRIRNKIFPILLSALILFPSKTGTEEYSTEKPYSDYLAEVIPNPENVKYGAEAFVKWLSLLNLTIEQTDSLSSVVGQAIQKYKAASVSSTSTGKREEAFGLAKSLEVVLDALPDSQRRRIERLQKTTEIYANYPELNDSARNDPDIGRYLRQAGITESQLNAKTKSWLERYSDSLDRHELMVMINKGEMVFNHAEPAFNRTESAVSNSPVFPEVSKGVDKGDVFGIPGTQAELAMGDVSFKKVDSKEAKARHIAIKNKEIRKSPNFDKFSKADIEAMDQKAREESWVVMDNGYRISETALEWFVDLKLKLAQEGYFIGISSTDESGEKGHSSLGHYTWDALDFKVYRILGKVVTGEDDNRREALLISQIDRHGSLEFEKLLEKLGIKAGKYGNEYRNPVAHSTGGHFHVLVPSDLQVEKTS